MTSVFFTFIPLLVLATLCASVDFSSPPKLPDLCFKHDRCNPKSPIRTCSCDSDCNTYQTCCTDVSKSASASHLPPDYQCYNSRRTAIGPVFAKRSCSEHFRGHVGTVGACLDDDDDDEMDVKNNLLVTSRMTNVTYWNKQCAACNDERPSDLEFWNIVVLCPSHPQVGSSLIRNNLTFDQDKLWWGLVIDNDFLRCFVRYSPHNSADEVKHCTPNIINKCPDNYKDKAVSTKCLQYYAERKLKNSDAYYKNTHCAICNGVDPKDLECPGMSSTEDDAEDGDFRDMVEEVFTNGQWLPDKLFECSRGYRYDAFREKCRVDKIVELADVMSSATRVVGTGFFVILVSVMMLLQIDGGF